MDTYHLLLTANQKPVTFLPQVFINTCISAQIIFEEVK
mgnify:CR=1 FL=1